MPVEAAAARRPTPSAPLWPWLVGAGVLALAGGAWAALRRRSAVEEDPVAAEPVEASPQAVPAAALTIAFRPLRAGLNLISATVEGEVSVTNLGDAAADDVRAELRLLSAHAGQEAELAAFHAGAAGRPATPPFALAPGEERRFRAVVALARDAMQVLEAGGRPMLVPLVALAVRYRDGERERRIGQVFSVGVERVDSAKLAPFWLDAPARSYESVAARAQGAAWETE